MRLYLEMLRFTLRLLGGIVIIMSGLFTVAGLLFLGVYLVWAYVNIWLAVVVGILVFPLLPMFMCWWFGVLDGVVP